MGGLREEFDKGVFVVVDQYIDRTYSRATSFYDGGEVCHISQVDPFCPEMNDIFYDAGVEMGLQIKKGGTYVCVQGPRFGTRAESNMFRQWGGDIVGMTVFPEVVLAAELNMCYSCIATVTDLDCWATECELATKLSPTEPLVPIVALLVSLSSCRLEKFLKQWRRMIITSAN